VVAKFCSSLETMATLHHKVVVSHNHQPTENTNCFAEEHSVVGRHFSIVDFPSIFFLVGSFVQNGGLTSSAGREARVSRIKGDVCRSNGNDKSTC